MQISQQPHLKLKKQSIKLLEARINKLIVEQQFISTKLNNYNIAQEILHKANVIL